MLYSTICWLYSMMLNVGGCPGGRSRAEPSPPPQSDASSTPDVPDHRSDWEDRDWEDYSYVPGDQDPLAGLLDSISGLDFTEIATLLRDQMAHVFWPVMPTALLLFQLL